MRDTYTARARARAHTGIVKCECHAVTFNYVGQILGSDSRCLGVFCFVVDGGGTENRNKNPSTQRSS